MSLHPSFGKNSNIQKKRNVLKRHQRIDILKEKGTWSEDKNSIYRLPKTKNEA
ncbi:MAG: small basic protein [Candidatus Aureabacteria bacterium]|nr:small basic protein [Candidatus Auribacterota bacterium]